MDMLKKNNIKKIISSAAILGAFGFFAASYVSIIHIITQNKIQYQEQKHRNELFSQIVPSQLYDNNIGNSCFIFNNKLLGDVHNHRLWLAKKNHNITAIIFEMIAPDGYSGAIKMIIALDIKNKKILGVRVLDHKETPGIGDKIDIHISDWIKQFSDIPIFRSNDYDLSLKKYGGNIDQFTGATITPLAVVNSIKRVITLIKLFSLTKINSLLPCSEQL